MSHSAWITTGIFILDLVLRIGFAIRVIMRRLPVGIALAWLLVILVFPLAGPATYLLLGEYRLGRHRTARIRDTQRQWGELLDASGHDKSCVEPNCLDDPRLPTLAASLFQSSLIPNNHLELLEDADAVFPALQADVNAAQRSCDLEFYIWQPGGRVDDLAKAVEQAAARGVRCRLLVDALGSKSFLRSPDVARMRARGVDVQAALKTSLLGLPFVRPDLRLHRKLVIIDGQVGYTGSLNMADPREFKQQAGVGQWVDAMARIRGTGVNALAASFITAWSVETGCKAIRDEIQVEPLSARPAGSALLQVLPSGPNTNVDGIERVVLAAIYSARRRVTLTTPYFVPSESLFNALVSVAGAGVNVTLIMPNKVDSKLVHHASRAYQADLLQAGVQVMLYEQGLLHTKSITIDEDLALFGSLNLDPRSLRLNFEITLAVYDRQFSKSLTELQNKYLGRSRRLTLDECRRRSGTTRFVENTARLLGPLL